MSEGSSTTTSFRVLPLGTSLTHRFDPIWLRSVVKYSKLQSTKPSICALLRLTEPCELFNHKIFLLSRHNTLEEMNETYIQLR